MSRLTIALVAVAMIATGCGSPLGRDVPECDAISNTMVLQVQSVPSAAYAACVDGLKPGWEYEHAEIVSGRSVFWLDSDRMGAPFVTVELLPSCRIGNARPDNSGQQDVRLFKDVDEESTVRVVLVPEGPSEASTARALDILTKLRDLEIKNRTVAVTVSTEEGTTQQRINRAAAAGAHVIIISIRDAEQGDLSLRPRGSNEEIRFEGQRSSAAENLDENFEDAVDEIEDVERQPTYSGNWYYVFDGGCVVYTFDAEGDGVSTIESDVEAALGLFDAEALRDIARDLGYNI